MANQPKKYTKFVAAAATATLVASAIVPVASAAGFSDVADTNSHAVNINALAEAGIIGGYPDGTFKPNQELTRGQVVKMLGKWVEAQGFEIPADYATKARFTDLAADAKDQELVKYAALVFDTGVFAGSNGALNAGGKITRENMALVLDRAFKAINDTTLVEVAAEIEDITVADLNTAKSEAREAIQALRNLGISGVENFMPKDSVTRAQFATFLNKTINTDAVVELTVKEAVAVDANTVEVTLSDDTKHTVKLEKALEANKETEVTFKIEEAEYTAKVTYVVEKLLVEEVSAINAKQIVVKFTKEIDASTVVNADTDALKNITVTKVGSAASTGLTAELSEDKKSVTITAGNSEVFNGSYVVNVATDVKTTAGEKVEAYSQILKVEDKVAPSFLSAEAVAKTSTKEVTVKFDEPVKADGVIAYVNGTAATVKAGTKANELVVVSSLDLAAGSAVSIKLTNVQDYNNNYTTPNPLEFNTTVVADVVAPSVVSADVTGENKVVVTFDKDLDNNQAAALASKARLTALNGASSIAPTVTIDGKKATFTFSPSYDATTGLATGIFYLDAGVKDKLGNESTTAFNKQVTFSKDVVKPTVETVQYKDNAIVATFSEKVTIANGSTLVAINKATGKSSTITVNTSADATTGKTTLSTDGKTVTVSNHGLADGTYELRLPAGLVSDEAGVPNASAYITTVLEVKATAVTPEADTTKPELTFDVNESGAITVDESDAKEYKFGYTLADNVAIDFGSVLNISNYTYDGKALPTGSYVTTDAVDVNDKSVEVTIHVPKTSVATTVTNGTFSVVGVKDAAGNSLDGVKSTKLTLVDGVAPVLNSAKLVSNSLVVGFSEAVTADSSDLIVKINGKVLATTPELTAGTGSDEGKFLINLSNLIVSGTNAVADDVATEEDEAAAATPSYIDLDGVEGYSSTLDIKIADGAIDTSAFKFSTSTVITSLTISTDEVDGDLETADEAGNTLTEGTSVKVK